MGLNSEYLSREFWLNESWAYILIISHKHKIAGPWVLVEQARWRFYRPRICFGNALHGFLIHSLVTHSSAQPVGTQRQIWGEDSCHSGSTPPPKNSEEQCAPQGGSVSCGNSCFYSSPHCPPLPHPPALCILCFSMRSSTLQLHNQK